MCARRINRHHEERRVHLQDKGSDTGSHGGKAHAVLDGSASVGDNAGGGGAVLHNGGRGLLGGTGDNGGRNSLSRLGSAVLDGGGDGLGRLGGSRDSGAGDDNGLGGRGRTRRLRGSRAAGSGGSGSTRADRADSGVERDNGSDGGLAASVSATSGGDVLLGLVDSRGGQSTGRSSEDGDGDDSGGDGNGLAGSSSSTGGALVDGDSGGLVLASSADGQSLGSGTSNSATVVASGRDGRNGADGGVGNNDLSDGGGSARNTRSARLDSASGGAVDGGGGQRSGGDSAGDIALGDGLSRDNGDEGGAGAGSGSLIDKDGRIGVGISDESINSAEEGAGSELRVVRSADAGVSGTASLNAVNDPVVAESGLASDHAGLAGRENGTLDEETAADEVLGAIVVLEDLVVVFGADDGLGVGEGGGAVVARVRDSGHGSTVVGGSAGRDLSRSAVVVRSRRGRVVVVTTVVAAGDSGESNTRSLTSRAIGDLAEEGASIIVGVEGGTNTLGVCGASGKAVVEGLASSLGEDDGQINLNTRVGDVDLNEEGDALESEGVAAGASSGRRASSSGSGGGV